jgi:hypothetical protein
LSTAAFFNGPLLQTDPPPKTVTVLRGPCAKGDEHEAFKSALSVLLVEDDKEHAVFVRQGLEDESCSRRGTGPKTW